MTGKVLVPKGPLVKPLSRGASLTSHALEDQTTREAIEPFDFAWDGSTTWESWDPPTLPNNFVLGVVVGSSGSGKSTMLRAWGGAMPNPKWQPRHTIASHFADASDAINRLTAVGLASVPVWCKPYEVLSNGERFRANLARQMLSGARVDEFSSVVDRHVAMAASRGFGRWIRGVGMTNIILATCHRDVLPWLNPDWIIDTDAGLFVRRPREWLQGATLVVEVRRARREAWDHFVEHHYLATTLHPFARCYLATWEDHLVGFAAAIPFPHGSIKGAWRETRTVVLPEFQGLGLGSRISNAVAALHVAEGYRYFSRTQHPRLGEWRERSPLWRPTSSNRKKAKPPENAGKNMGHYTYDDQRVAYSHEYIGPPSEQRDPMMPSTEQRAKAYNYKKAR